MQSESSDQSSPSEHSITALAEYGALFGLDSQIEWQMETSEQACLIAFAQKLQPECVIEIGSRFGGSMQIFSRYAKRVISCDIDPTCQERFGHKYPNAEFIVGPSQETLPPLLARLQQESVRLSLMLIDGDHSEAGIQSDIHALRDYRPVCPLYVILHDSFNPYERRGIRTARWAENPHVHSVELDFITGTMNFTDEFYRQLWGGFALAVLKPERRTGPLTITAKSEPLFRILMRKSGHTIPRRAIRKLGKMFGVNHAGG